MATVEEIRRTELKFRKEGKNRNIIMTLCIKTKQGIAMVKNVERKYIRRKIKTLSSCLN